MFSRLPITIFAASLAWIHLLQPAYAQDCDATCLAKKAQDPLGDVRAIMTDNTVSLGAFNENTAYSFQVQPVYSVQTDQGFNVILRGIIPILGVKPGTYIPPIGVVPGGSTQWGLGDSIIQAFITPQSDSSLKYGFGPQVSVPTHTSAAHAGPEWGAGLAGVVFGSAGQISYGGIVGQHWGRNSFSVTSIQPILMYNFESLPGAYIGYNNTITYDWRANGWQVPLGLMAGRTFQISEQGHALDLSVGAYSIVTAPFGAADTQIKFGMSLFLP